jgi:hypothetical protein
VRLGDAFAAALRAIVEARRASRQPVFTPSDFPEAGLDQRQLDSFLDRLQSPGHQR